MDILTTLATCSYVRDYTLVLAMAFTFGRGAPNPYNVRELAELAAAPLDGADVAPEDASGDEPKTRDAGIKKLRRAMANKQAVLVGVLPVPLAWAARFQRSPEDLLTACVNVTVATAMLASFERGCRKSKDARSCVLDRYAREIGSEFFAEDVAQTIAAQRLGRERHAVIQPDAFSDAPIFGDGAGDWGASGIFFKFDEPTTRQRAVPNHVSSERK